MQEIELTIFDHGDEGSLIRHLLDWTVVRYPRLMGGEHTRKYRVGFVGKESGTQLSRADGADFVVKELTERKWLGKLPLVSY